MAEAFANKNLLLAQQANAETRTNAEKLFQSVVADFASKGVQTSGMSKQIGEIFASKNLRIMHLNDPGGFLG
jgi:hypothetical protein